MSSSFESAARLDITKDVCPITFVKTKLELEEMGTGEVLEVRLREGEPLENVSRSLAAEGHAVLSREALGGGVWRLWVRKG